MRDLAAHAMTRPTDRLYFNDSRLLSFDAEVIAVDTSGAHPFVVLDRSAFYPSSDE